MLTWPVTKNREDILKWARENFVWTRDKEVWQIDEFWATEAELEHNALLDGVENGVVHDDCDGFAAMCVIACRKNGLQARYVVVATEQCPPGVDYDHCVAESGGVIFDNRYAASLDTKEDLEIAGYRFWATSGTKPGEPWKRIV